MSFLYIELYNWNKIYMDYINITKWHYKNHLLIMYDSQSDIISNRN
jgi:hypothetical protein